MNHRVLVVCACLLLLPWLAAQRAARDDRRISPFRGMRAVENGLEVQVADDTWFALGRAVRHRLPKSGLRLQLSTMASFRPDGVLFEGNGVAPDVVVAAEPGDLIGASDAVLQRALALLR